MYIKKVKEVYNRKPYCSTYRSERYIDWLPSAILGHGGVAVKVRLYDDHLGNNTCTNINTWSQYVTMQPGARKSDGKRRIYVMY